MTMKKTGKIIAGVAALGAAAVVGAGVFFYGTLFQKAEQTIETMKILTDGTSFEIDADCDVTLNANSTDAMLLAAIIQKAIGSDKTSFQLSAVGQSSKTDFDLDISAGLVGADSEIKLTDLIKADNDCYIGVDSLISAVAGDAIDSNLLVKIAYEGWIKDHYVSWTQLKQLITDLTGKNLNTGEISVTWADLFVFLCSPEHLFDPDLWSAVQISKEADGYSIYQINADYFSELIGLDSDMIEAQLEFCVDKESKAYDLKMDITVTDDYGNQIQTLVEASAAAMKEQAEISTPELLLSDEKISQMKEIIQNLLGGI